MNTSYFIFRYIFLVDLCQFRLATRFAYYIHPSYVTKQLLTFNILRPLFLNFQYEIAHTFGVSVINK